MMRHFPLAISLCIFCFCRPPAALSNDDIPLLLDVRVNGYAINKIGEFVQRKNQLLATRKELTELGFKIDAPLPQNPDALISLADLPHVQFHLNTTTQTLDVETPGTMLLPTILDGKGGLPDKTHITARTDTGLSFSYDLNGVWANNAPFGSGASSVHVFSPYGVLSSNQTVYFGIGTGGAGSVSFIRQSTAYTYSDPAHMRQYSLGDVVSGQTSWSRSVQLGGFQIATQFSMQPDLIPFSTPTINSTANGPSMLDVQLNGYQFLSQAIPGGPFQVPQLPVGTGAGELISTVTGINGAKTRFTTSFYTAASLLKKGLSSFSLEGGLLRQYWGSLSPTYKTTALSGTYRRGLYDRLTIETHLEGSTKLLSLSAGAYWNVFSWGILNASAAGSNAGGGSGGQIAAGFQRNGRIFSVGASALLSTAHYRDLAWLSGSPVAKQQLNAYTSLSFGRFGNVNVTYSKANLNSLPISLNYYIAPGTFTTNNQTIPGTTITTGKDGNVIVQPSQETQILSVGYSLQFWTASFYASFFRAFAGGGGTGGTFGISIPLGTRSSGSVSTGLGANKPYQQIQMSQTATVPGQWGYQLSANHGTQNIENGTIKYKSGLADFYAGVDSIGPQTSYRGEVQGSISLLKNQLFFSAPIYDSFGVIDTGGVPSVRVFAENREVGRTNTHGMLLLPDLRSFSKNHISIDPADVPPDADLPSMSIVVEPMDRSGVLVPFPIQSAHSALLHLVDENGHPLPVGGAVQTVPVSPVGFDGSAYLSGLLEENTITVLQHSGQRCTAHFSYHSLGGAIPVIGPVRCVPMPH